MRQAFRTPFYGDFFIDVLAEILTKYPAVDAFSFDGLHYGGVCYCRHCRDNYRKDARAEIPEADMNDPAFRRYQHWADRRMEDLVRRMQERLKRIKPEVALVTWSTNAGRFGHFLSIPRNMPARMNLLLDAPDQEFWLDETNRGTTIVPAFANATIWAMTNHRTAFSEPYILSHGNPYGKDSFPPQEILRRMLLTLTYGAAPSIAVGQPANLQQELYACLDEVKRRKPWMSHKKPEPWAALVLSDNTRNFYGRDPGRVEERYMAAVFGTFRAAVEEHRVLAVINDWNLNPEDLAPYKVLILANTACLDDVQAGAIAQFVERGGGLVASLDASLFDDYGNPRSDFTLSRVFGVEHRGIIAATAPGRPEPLDENFAKSIGPDYWEKRKNVFDFKQDVGSFLNRGRMPTYVGAQSVTFKGPAVRVVPTSPAARVVGTLRVKSGEGPSGVEVPGVVAHTFGRGRVVYFAGGFDAAYYLYAYPYQRLMLANAIDWVAPAPQPVVVEAPMCVHSTVMRQATGGSERLIVHLYSDLNTTAFHALPNDDVPLREEVVPIHHIRVTFASEYRLGRIHLEPEGRDLKPEPTPGGPSVVVPRLDVHSMVVAELEPGPDRRSASGDPGRGARAAVAVGDRAADRRQAQQDQARGLGDRGPVGKIRERDLTGLGRGESQVDVVLGAHGHGPLIQQDVAGLDDASGEVLGIVEADGVGAGPRRAGDLPKETRPGHAGVVEDSPRARARVDEIPSRAVDIERDRNRGDTGEIQAHVGGAAGDGVDHGRAGAPRAGRIADGSNILGRRRGRQADQQGQCGQAATNVLQHRSALEGSSSQCVESVCRRLAPIVAAQYAGARARRGNAGPRGQSVPRSFGTGYCTEARDHRSRRGIIRAPEESRNGVEFFHHPHVYNDIVVINKSLYVTRTPVRIGRSRSGVDVEAMGVFASLDRTASGRGELRRSGRLGRLAGPEDEVGRRRLAAGGAHQRGNLAAVVQRVAVHVDQHVGECGAVPGALAGWIREVAPHVRIGQSPEVIGPRPLDRLEIGRQSHTRHAGREDGRGPLERRVQPVQPHPPRRGDVAHDIQGLPVGLRLAPVLRDGLQRLEHLAMAVLLVFEPASELIGERGAHGHLESRGSAWPVRGASVSPPGVPSIDDIQARDDAGDDPPGLARPGRVLFREIALAVRAPLGILEDLAAAVRAGHGRLVVPIIRPVLVLGVVHHLGIVVIPVAPSGHRLASSSAAREASVDARPIRGGMAPIVSRPRPACQADARSDRANSTRSEEAIMRSKQVGPAFIAGLILAGSLVAGPPDENDVYILKDPEHTAEEVARAYAEIPPVRYLPPADRWANLPLTATVLGRGEGTLRIVMLGDSIVNDTSRSRWDDLLRAAYPKCRIIRTTCVRGGTGCWWYREPGRVKRYVLDLDPDLLIIGGISHKDDTDSIRDVVRQVRKARKCDVLLMTGAFGPVDPRDDKQWRLEIDPRGADYRARLKRLADEEHAGFLDMSAWWGRYIRESGKDLDWFKRDPIHANIRGEQVLGHILAGHLAPPVDGGPPN